MGRKTKWRDEYPALAFRMAKAGESDDAIRQAMGVCPQTFLSWKSKRPEFAKMLEEGRRDAGAGFASYVYNRLPVELHDFWSTLVKLEEQGSGENYRRACHLDTHRMDRFSVREQQRFYVQSLVHCNFIHSRARAMCGLPLQTVERWIKTDGEFVRILDELDEAKRDFCEWALMDLVERRETAAVIFANRTLNRGRGYSEKVTIDVRNEEKTALEELASLTVEQRRMLYEALERGRLPDHSNVIDVEVIE